MGPHWDRRGITPHYLLRCFVCCFFLFIAWDCVCVFFSIFFSFSLSFCRVGHGSGPSTSWVGLGPDCFLTQRDRVGSDRVGQSGQYLLHVAPIKFEFQSVRLSHNRIFHALVAALWLRRRPRILTFWLQMCELDTHRGRFWPKNSGGIASSVASSPSPFYPFTETETNTNSI